MAIDSDPMSRALIGNSLTVMKTGTVDAITSTPRSP